MDNLKIKIDEFTNELLDYCNVDHNDPNVKETADRIYRMYTNELLTGYREDPIKYLKTFKTDNVDGEIIIENIPVKSLCAHHLLPFYGNATIKLKYQKEASVLGLSKFHRIVNHFSRKLQLQENLTKEIAEFLYNNLSLEGIIVEIEARHMCVEHRGVNVNNSLTKTICKKGIYKEG